MIQKGARITCTGCGCSTFIENVASIPTPIAKFKETSHVFAYNQEQSDSWARVHQIMDLCPRCQKIHEKMLCKFYEECGGANDDEQT